MAPSLAARRLPDLRSGEAAAALLRRVPVVLSFRCPACGCRNNLRRSSLGGPYRCRGCRTRLRLPDDADDSEDLQDCLDERHERLEREAEDNRDRASEAARRRHNITLIIWGIVCGIVLIVCGSCCGFGAISRRNEPPPPKPPPAPVAPNNKR
jgi:hypothetical protein